MVFLFTLRTNAKTYTTYTYSFQQIVLLVGFAPSSYGTVESCEIIQHLNLLTHTGLIVKLYRLLSFFSISTLCSLVIAETVLIPFEKDDVPTAYWASAEAKATLIFLPGGDGSFGFANKPNAQPGWILSLINKAEPKESLNLVFMDSRTSLGYRGDLGPRTTSQHIERIKAVIDYYQQKTQLPMYLIGHSNGAVSLASFLNKSPENQLRLGGAIFSGSRNETRVNAKLNLPLLVLHHKDDPNGWTTPKNAERLFQEIKVTNALSTEQVWMEGGFDEGDVHTSGRHMYAGVLDKAAAVVKEFIIKNLKQ